MSRLSFGLSPKDSTDENRLTEWDEVLSDAEIEGLNQLVRELQPNLVMPEDTHLKEPRA